MIHIPPRDIPNGSAGVWRGPCLDAVEVLKYVVGVWPEEYWPTAVAVPFAEVWSVDPGPCRSGPFPSCSRVVGVGRRFGHCDPTVRAVVRVVAGPSRSHITPPTGRSGR